MPYSFEKLCSNTIPAGTYKVQVTDVKLTASVTGGTGKNFAVTYTIADGPMAKKTLTDTIFEKAYSFRLKPFLNACGVDLRREFATTEELIQYGANQAKGKIINITVTTRLYNGKEYNNVDSWQALPESRVSSADVLKEFGDVPTGRAETTQTSESISEPSAIVEDELPF